jgi:hypothetical protein
MCCCVDYLLTSLTIATSTHTNYFDHIFKERGVKPLLVQPANYTELFVLVNNEIHMP